jgi:hypothetical protein
MIKIFSLAYSIPLLVGAAVAIDWGIKNSIVMCLSLFVLLNLLLLFGYTLDKGSK